MPDNPCELPVYARPPGCGPTPKGVPIVDAPHKMAKGIVKVSKLMKGLTKTMPLKKSLIKRINKYPKTNKKRYF